MNLKYTTQLLIAADPVQNSVAVTRESLRISVAVVFHSLDSPPFTIQCVCELCIEPYGHYK